MLRQEENIKLKEKGHYIGVESEKHKCKNIWKQKKNIKKKEFQMYTCLQKHKTLKKWRRKIWFPSSEGLLKFCIYAYILCIYIYIYNIHIMYKCIFFMDAKKI